MKKIHLVIFVIMVAFLSACGSNTWVLEKDRFDEVGSVKNYVEQLQNEHTEFQEFRVFTISEVRKWWLCQQVQVTRLWNLKNQMFPITAQR
ncbi:hypothetical protein [Rossellomorea vietnamensis]|uniref:hypothetical protein n=1 Tax=Rossellomorea vietnamensis TaxID=218284 RepID=UPI00077CB20B|nr:hypothetical protein [Rossellomorea vietnamensis]